MIKQTANKLKFSNKISFLLFHICYHVFIFFKYRIFSDKYLIKKKFYRNLGYKINFVNPKTYNEKINWLKVTDRRQIITNYADKLKARELLAEKFGKQFLVPLIFSTESYKDICPENLPDYPVIIKPNHGSGWFKIIMNKNEINWGETRLECRFWLLDNYYYKSQEWQYRNIKPRLLVEKLLIPKDGGSPNNYRFHCMSGKIEIISVTIYHGAPSNYSTNKYDKDWKELYFFQGKITTEPKVAIPQPDNYNKMCFIAEEVAKDFPYVRVDFYEVDGEMYYGEVTFHDSGGLDKFYPDEWDTVFGEKLHLENYTYTD